MATLATTAAAITQPRESESWSAYFLLRVGGLAVDRCSELSTHRAAEWAAQVADLEEELHRRSPAVVDALFDVVKAHAEDREGQRRLLELKRAVYNRRVPANVEVYRAVLSKVEHSGVQPAVDWLNLADAHERLMQSGSELLRQEVIEKRAKLKKTLRDETFRKGLFMASESTERSLDAYLAAPDEATSRRLRLSERSALLYVFRAAWKTSPFSTLTPVTWGLIEDVPDAPSHLHYIQSGSGVRTWCALNITLFSRIGETLQRRDDILRELPVQLNSFWMIEGKRVRYLRRIVTLSETEGPQPVDTVKMVPYYLPLSATVNRILEIMAGGDTRTVHELLSELVARSGDPDSLEDYRNLVRLLIELGLLASPSLWMVLTALDPAQPFMEALAEFRHPDVDAVRHHLETALALCQQMSEADAWNRRKILTGIRREVTAAFAHAGSKEADVPSTLVYEDGLLDPPELHLPAPRWRPHLEELQDFQRILPLLDPYFPERLVMNAFFKAVYGAGRQCPDVVSFYEVFRHDYYEQYQQGQMTRMMGGAAQQSTANHFNVPEIAQLNEARRLLSDKVSELRAANPDSRELILDPALVRQIGDAVPVLRDMPQSHCFAVQLAAGNGAPRLVVNKIYPGLGHLYSRFLRPLSNSDLTSGLSPVYREQLLALQPRGAVFAQLPGGVAGNLNMIPAVALYEIVFPGGRSLRPTDEQLPVSDLYVQHNASRDTLELRSTSLGQRVIPLYLGFLIPAVLPDLYQILLKFSPMAYIPSLSLLPADDAQGDAITCSPRVRYGSIVLERAAWTIPYESIPQRTDAVSDAQHMVAVVKWRRAHGLPRRGFLKPVSRPRPRASQETAKPPDEAGDSATVFAGMTNKPMYVDFDSHFSLGLVDRLVSKRKGELQLVECLPDEDELCLRTGEGSYVTEFMIELNREVQEN